MTLSELDAKLLAAAESGTGYLEIPELINKGANVNVLNEFGQTPLIICLASRSNKKSKIMVANLFLDSGSNVNLGGRNARELPEFEGLSVLQETALHYAARLSADDLKCKPVEILKLVRRMVEDHGANLNITNGDMNPWQYANHFHVEPDVDLYLELCLLQESLKISDEQNNKNAHLKRAKYIAEEIWGRLENNRMSDGFPNKADLRVLRDYRSSLKAMFEAVKTEAGDAFFLGAAEGFPRNIAQLFAQRLSAA